MKLASLFSTNPGHSRSADPRPRDDELDLFGVTHPGRVRAENQDHFLLCTVHPQVVIHGTSLPDPDGLALRGQRMATIMLVARSEEHTSELQSRQYLVCRLLLEKKKQVNTSFNP